MIQPQESVWLPARIRSLRKRLGLTQAEMAAHLGYSSGRRVAELESEAEWGKPASGPVTKVLDHLDAHGPLPATGTPAEPGD